MGFGLFGKLPQKRDFVSANLPNAVLNPFETWLQSCVAASRNDIGREWENYYLVAPIWHFWLGPEVLGTACAGALMPSVDQVGRYFPLSILYLAEKDEVLLPPILAPLEDWYRQLDERLLAVLAEQREFEIAAVLSGLVPPVFDGALAELTMVAPGQPAPAMQQVMEPAPPPPEPEVVAPVEPEPEPVVDAAPPPPEPEPVVEPLAAEPAAAAPDAPAGGSPWDEPASDAAPAVAAAAAPVASIADFGESLPWDDPVPAAAVPEAEVAPKPAVPSAAWDDLPDLDAKDFGLPVTAAASNIRDRPPTGKTIPPTPAAPPPAPSLNAAPALNPDGSAMAALPAPMVYSELFKGGIDMRIEQGRTQSEALAGLLALDYQHMTTGRSYWWCAAPANGYAAFFARQGLPDPYYFSRMLQWAGESQAK